MSSRCFHLSGTGGIYGAVEDVAKNIEGNTFVFRTDVKSYYASINHDVLMGLVKEYVDDELVVNLIQLYLKRFVSKDGVYVDIQQGISLGCSLSPLMGALYLKPLDDEMSKLDLFYARYMDDWVILAPTRWKLRKAVKIVNGVLNQLMVVKHPDKTLIGRISRGFDFLGFWFSSSGISIGAKSFQRILLNATRLYEQGADSLGIELYLNRAIGWFVSGLHFLTNIYLYHEWNKYLLA